MDTLVDIFVKCGSFVATSIHSKCFTTAVNSRDNTIKMKPYLKIKLI
jgi:hypothetical protein